MGERGLGLLLRLVVLWSYVSLSSCVICCASQREEPGDGEALRALLRRCDVVCEAWEEPFGSPVGERRSPVPRVVHQSWAWASVPAHFEDYVRSWVTVQRAWRYVFWTDEDVSKLLGSRAGSTAEGPGTNSSRGLWEGRWKLLSGAYRSELARYAILFVYGGAFVDLDVEALGPLDGFLETRVAPVLGVEPKAHAAMVGRAKVASSAVLLSARGHAFLSHVLGVMRSAAFLPDGRATPDACESGAGVASRARRGTRLSRPTVERSHRSVQKDHDVEASHETP